MSLRPNWHFREEFILKIERLLKIWKRTMLSCPINPTISLVFAMMGATIFWARWAPSLNMLSNSSGASMRRRISSPMEQISTANSAKAGLKVENCAPPNSFSTSCLLIPFNAVEMPTRLAASSSLNQIDLAAVQNILFPGWPGLDLLTCLVNFGVFLWCAECRIHLELLLSCWCPNASWDCSLRGLVF